MTYVSDIDLKRLIPTFEKTLELAAPLFCAIELGQKPKMPEGIPMVARESDMWAIMKRMSS